MRETTERLLRHAIHLFENWTKNIDENIFRGFLHHCQIAVKGETRARNFVDEK